MIRNNRRNRKYVGHVVLASVLTGLGVYANAGEFVLDGSVAIGGNSVSVSSDGLVTRVTGIPTTHYGIPDVSFAMTSNDVDDGDYSFKVGISFDDDNSTSRIEVYLPALDVTVTGGAITTGTLDTAQQIRVLAFDGDVTVQALLNVPASSPVTVTSGEFNFDMSAIIDAIGGGDHPSIQAIIASIFNNDAVKRNYTYRIATQQIGSSAIRIGTDSGSFVPFPRIQTSCELNSASQLASVFTLDSHLIANNFTAAYAIQGQFSVAGATGQAGSAPVAFTETCSTSTPPTTPTVDNTTDAINDVITNGGTPTDTQITALVTASENLSSTLTSTDPETVTTSTLSTLTDSVTKLIATNAALIDSGNASTSVSAATTSVVSTVATVLKDFSQKETLTSEEANAGLEVVKDLLNNSESFFADEDDDDENLASMNDLLEATFTLGAKANPPVEFKAQDYASAVEALNKLNERNSDGGQCGNPALMALTNSTAGGITSAAINFPWTFVPNVYFPVTSSFIQFSPITLVPDYLRPVASWFTQNLDFSVDIFGLSLKVGPCGSVTTTVSRAASGPVEIEKDLDSNTLKIKLGQETYLGSIFNVSLLPSNFEDGNLALADGSILLAQEGLGYVISSTAADFEKFTDAVESAGFDLTARTDGGFDIRTGPTQTFSGVFAYDNIAGYEGECGVVSIGEPTGPVNSPEYAFTATCGTSGMTQRIVPYISQSAFYNLGASFEVGITTDRNSGIINVEGIGSFKPSFFSNALTVNDAAFLNANAVNGFAFRTSDVNGDGKIDFEVVHSSGVQVLYGL